MLIALICAKTSLWPLHRKLSPVHVFEVITASASPCCLFLSLPVFLKCWPAKRVSQTVCSRAGSCANYSSAASLEVEPPHSRNFFGLRLLYFFYFFYFFYNSLLWKCSVSASRRLSVFFTLYLRPPSCCFLLCAGAALCFLTTLRIHLQPWSRAKPILDLF